MMIYQKRHRIGKGHFILVAVAAFGLAAPLFCGADLIISEVMYNLEGSDSGRKWLEIKNTDSADIDITGWKFADLSADGTISRHNLYVPPDHGGVGTMIIKPNSFVILADDAATFIGEYGNTGTIIDTTISNFGQQDGRTYGAKLIDKDGNEVSSMIYTISMGANGDGNSLQLSGSNWISAIPTPGALTAVSASPPPPTAQPTATTTDTGGQSQNTYSGSVNRAPVEPQIFAYISGEKTATIGVEAIFKGTAFGFDKKPIANPRYLWSFGDGVTREGQTVAHAWRMPGDYLVVLEVSSGEFNASTRQKIAVFLSQISIEKIETGSDGFVSIKNGLSDDVDISRWGIKSRDKLFIFPVHTIIIGGTIVAFANSITGLDPDIVKTELLYPNGLVALVYEPSKVLAVEKKISTDEQNNKSVAKENSQKSTSVALIKKNENLEQKSPVVSNSESIASTSVIYKGAATASGSGVSMDWIMALAGIVGVGGLGVLFSMRKKGAGDNLAPNEGVNGETGGDEKPPNAEEFEVIEEKE